MRIARVVLRPKIVCLLAGALLFADRPLVGSVLDGSPYLTPLPRVVHGSTADTTLTAAEIANILRKAGISSFGWVIGGKNYRMLDAAWVQERLWPAWVQTLPNELVETATDSAGKKILRPKWIAEIFDHDDISMDFMDYALRCGAVGAASNREDLPRSLLLGTLAYLPETKIGAPAALTHDVNWFVDTSGRMVWFDAQFGVIIHPSAHETVSVQNGQCR